MSFRPVIPIHENIDTYVGAQGLRPTSWFVSRRKLKCIEIITQSDLSDFVFEPVILIRGEKLG